MVTSARQPESADSATASGSGTGSETPVVAEPSAWVNAVGVRFANDGHGEFAATDRQHLHEPDTPLPERLSGVEIKPFMQTHGGRYVAALACEWSMIISVAVACDWLFHPVLYVAAVILIGARQHALLILGHDASHFLFFRHRKLNDWMANLFVYWPTFSSVQGFRYFHAAHHQFLNTDRDRNRLLWGTHTREGVLTREWSYPKSRLQLAWKLLRKACFLTGLTWVVLGLLSMFIRPEFRSRSWLYVVLRTGYYAAAMTALAHFGWVTQFVLYWLVPYVTWHVVVEYIRLICEHSAVQSNVEPYHETRTTVPRALERLLILPCSVGYHHEHHWYPGVPFYRLPALHAVLMERTGFGRFGNVCGGVFESLSECCRSSASERSETAHELNPAAE